MFRSRKIDKPTVFEDVTSGLKQIYKENLLPLEKEVKFHDFHSPQLVDPDFDGKPLVMLVGQFSTGKTTFIRSARSALIDDPIIICVLFA